MTEKKDYFSYFIGIAGLTLTVISFFNKDDQKISVSSLGSGSSSCGSNYDLHRQL